MTIPASKVEKRDETYPAVRPFQDFRYQFRVLKEEHVAQATELFIKAFCDGEPMTRYLGVSYDEYRPFVNKTLQKAVQEGLSIVALDKGKVIALNVFEDLASPLIIDFPVSHTLQIIFALLDDLSKPFIDQIALEKNKIAHYFILAIDREYHGSNLSKVVISENFKLLHTKNYDFFFTELTNPLMQRIAKDYQTVKLVQIDYASFRYQAEYPFVGLEGYAASYIGKIGPHADLIFKDRQRRLDFPAVVGSRL